MGSAKYKQGHREMGLCVDCVQPAHDGKNRCMRHLEMQSKTQQRYRKRNLEVCRVRQQRKKQRRKDTGKCVKCAAPLDPDADGSCVTCVNCRGGIYNERLVHGTPIV